MVLRVSLLMALIDFAATASLWYYLAEAGVRGVFLYTLAAAWIFSICVLTVLLVYIAVEVNGRSFFGFHSRRQH